MTFMNIPRRRISRNRTIIEGFNPKWSIAEDPNVT